MSQCCARKRRLAVVIALAAGLGLQLGACSKEALRQAVTTGDEQAPARPLDQPRFGRKDEPEVLRPAGIITTGKRSEIGMTGEFARMLTGSTETVRLERPVAVSGYGDTMFIVDAAERAIYRYNRRDQTIVTLGEAGKQFVGDPMGLYVEPDLSFFVCDPAGKAVYYFDADGRVIRTYSDLKNLSRPVDVVFDEVGNRVLVADGSFSHIVVFDKMGEPLAAIGDRGTGPGRFRAITALAKVNNSLFVADRLELRVQELDMDGTFRYSFGEGSLTWPTAIVVDKYQRLYVSDRSDNTIRVYDDIRLIATLGGTGSAPGRFRLITDMWLADDGKLYVADSLNRRVQIFDVVSDTPVMPNFMSQ